MLPRPWPIVVVVFSLLVPSALRAQVVEEDDTQVLKPVAPTIKPSNRPDLSEAVKRLIIVTNQFREKEKLARVEVDPQLRKAAQYFADYMARTNRYGHKADGSTPADRAQKFGYDYCIVAENIGYA